MKIKFWLIIVCWSVLFANEVVYREDDSITRVIESRELTSHIKVFLPLMPYNYVSRLVNEGLVRLAENEQGWEYSLAIKSTKISPTLYEFELRQGVMFQDGTPFNADSVVHNFELFLKQPFVYTDIHHSLKAVEKRSNHVVRIHLHKPYGMLFRDLARIYFYSEGYLKQYGWSGAETGANIKVAGPYGLGPYILKEGRVTGREQTDEVVLEANPYYWEKSFPKIQKITFFTQLEIHDALFKALFEDGGIDFMQIPFNKKIETMLSPYAKLVSLPSSNNFTIYFNLQKETSPIYRKEIRQALNCALNQKNLLNFTYKKEGTSNSNALDMGECHLSEEQIRGLLQGIELHVATQDSLLFLWKGVEYQLARFGVTLNYMVTTSEKEIYDLVQKNHHNLQSWDMIIQGTQDYYGRHPWPIFIRYQENNPWSFVKNDAQMKTLIEAFFRAEQDSPLFNELTQKIRQRAKEEAYMLFVPTPNVVFAMNKELVFEPLGIGMQPFWTARITREHWSMRGDKSYPNELKNPIEPKRRE